MYQVANLPCQASKTDPATRVDELMDASLDSLKPHEAATLTLKMVDERS